MKKIFALTCLLAGSLIGNGQKKPLDHTVYNSWESISEKMISHDGHWILYAVNPQEGDGWLIIESADTQYKKSIARGYRAAFTADNQFAVCLVKPLFKETREARIRKKKPEDMPKDSLVIIRLGTDSILRIPRIQSYKLPVEGSSWLAYLAEKPVPPNATSSTDSASRLQLLIHMADSLSQAADSLRRQVADAKTRGMNVLAKPSTKPSGEPVEEGTLMTLIHLQTGKKRQFELVNNYQFNRSGKVLAIGTTKKQADSGSRGYVLWFDLASGRIDTVMKGLHQVKNFALDEAGTELAFVAERDSAAKAVQKFFKLWYFKPGIGSAFMIVDRNTAGIGRNQTVSEHYDLSFSKSGRRILLGVSPIRPQKDTTVPDFEKAALDVWNYRDDELQPVQLKNLDRELKRSYLAVYDIASRRLQPLGNEEIPDVLVTGEGDGTLFYAASDFGRRVEWQWQGFSFLRLYSINPETGEKLLIADNFKGRIFPSYTGKYLLLFNEQTGRYQAYNEMEKALKAVASDIAVSLSDEENDVPDDPPPYGIAGWEKGDEHVFVYDRYTLWKVDPEGKERSTIVGLPDARQKKIVLRYVPSRHEEKYLDPSLPAFFHAFYETSKQSRYITGKLDAWPQPDFLTEPGPYSCNGFQKADSSDAFLFTKESYILSPDIFLATLPASGGMNIPRAVQLSHLNPQQAGYLWGSAELFSWKSFSGKQSEGLLFKPENFDPGKKYPMIVYYYERNNGTLYNYRPPAPTPSALNIPFFVSRGYVVFVPDIWYRKGHPGKSAYDFVVSGTRALVAKGFIDSTRLGLQGQSWGGYQTAYIITQTPLFAAAWAGAPVVNMFSAYGGIRWESGLNRQFQYEKTQSRIGASIWERPDLYIENSPLFHLQRVKTPLVIMSNDADGAVPWYQGIEFFTAMRRLKKPIWLLSYNGEAHNLVERRNRLDIQIRQQQFFDWLLKGDAAPKWITEGVPATLKGIDWGLGSGTDSRLAK